MKAEELEPGMDEFFHRRIPDLMDWEGSSAEEVEKIERIVREFYSRDLPKLYRWFLLRMGRSMGKFSYPDMDYSASTVLSWYGEYFADDGTKLFKDGHSADSELELHMYYDFNYPIRDDARLTLRQAEGGEDYRHFETFREMLATKAAHIHAIKFPEYCIGTLVGAADILPQLDPVLDSLGFKKPNIPTGPRCGLYEGSQATLVTTGSLDLGLESCGFALGGIDAKILSAILGTIATETDLILDVKDHPRQLEKRP
jgi:hypothetical protein